MAFLTKKETPKEVDLRCKTQIHPSGVSSVNLDYGFPRYMVISST
jgi:hypothetical protein